MGYLPDLLTIPSAEEVKDLMKRLKGLENRIHALNHKVHIREEEMAVLRRVNVFLIRNSFRYLGNLYYVYLVTGSTGSVSNQLQVIWKEACGRPERMNRLIGFLDRQLDNLVWDLRSAVPNLREQEIIMFCCYAVGFDAPLISLLLGVSVNAVYARKNRMIGKIRKLGPARSRRYLELIE